MSDSSLLHPPAVLFALVLARVGGLLLLAPIFGTQAVPRRVRILLAASVALLLTPVCLATTPSLPEGKAALAVALGSELLLGMLLGLGVATLLAGVQMAGQMIAQVSGLGLFDTGLDSQSPAVSQLLFMLALALFFLIDGHRLAMHALLDTFQSLPPGKATFNASLLETLTALLSQSFLLGLRTAAPAVTALLLATLALGLVSRTLPQLNVLAVGLGLNSLLALAALLLSLGAVAWAMEEQLQPTFDLIGQSLSWQSTPAPDDFW